MIFADPPYMLSNGFITRFCRYGNCYKYDKYQNCSLETGAVIAENKIKDMYKAFKEVVNITV